MAHQKLESVGSGMLDHRVRPGPVPHSQEPESEDMELPLEGYVPEGLELAALRPESPMHQRNRSATTTAPMGTPVLTT
ncbi:APBA2 isoform 8 [Pongo abelii]|uniref:APBA2 isoform 5 n=1 Tax=Pongo abelii TaxID=9601 RepID=A0A2J8RFF5_PONAB|nr:APBA2 isoform 5 [Pongo abelii]PNJ07263.1 APBA2 isoform 8 [Pongo abelii]